MLKTAYILLVRRHVARMYAENSIHLQARGREA